MLTLMSERLPCFKAYDIRGRIPDQLNAPLARQIGRAYAKVIGAKKVVVGYDMRLSSPELANEVRLGLCEMGVDVVDIGLCGTEMVYFSTFHLEDQGVDGGIMVTASHNPADYNGMKLVKRGSVPISGDSGLFDIEEQARNGVKIAGPDKDHGSVYPLSIMNDYVAHLLSYVDAKSLSKFKIVENPGNGCAGIVIDALEAMAGALPVEFFKVHHQPDGKFPNGVPNPLLEENRASTAEEVIAQGADFGVAWDGDFDRCFFFDEKGEFVDGYYIVSLFAEEMLADAPKGSPILYDPRLIWNTEATLEKAGARAVMCKTGHAFIKERMRKEDAIYGGEMSAHHYFKRFAYCDSGMIPWLLMLTILTKSGKKLSEMVADMKTSFPSSGEINRRLEDADAALAKIEEHYAPSADSVDRTDGISFAFDGWRFNLRKSQTEPVIRLNVESRGDRALMEMKTQEVLGVMESA